jgi:O-acetyl-ADP-ribose deacetylase (regulator of RNase III)
MIRYTEGDLLRAPEQAITNAVNTVGVMGKGLALQFKQQFQENFRAYAAACRAGEMVVGRVHLTRREAVPGPRWIINFPTKQDWRHPSRLEWVESGLHDLRRVLLAEGIRSVALPKLGCGLGGLDWDAVRPLIESILGDLEGVEVVVYEGEIGQKQG